MQRVPLTAEDVAAFIRFVANPRDEVAFKRMVKKADVVIAVVGITSDQKAAVEALIAAIEARGEKHGAGYEVQAEFENAPEMGLGSAGLGDLLPAEA
jgi:hypothetical protein